MGRVSISEHEHRGTAIVGSAYYPMLVAVFTALVIISNVTATKGVAFGPIITDGGFIVFPLTYVIGDVLSEVYGFKAARRAIVLGFGMNALAALAFWITVYLPAADFYTNQEHFENVVGAYTQLIVAGLAGFLVGQTINAWVVVAIKQRTKEKHLWARLIGSTFAGQLGDTLVFCAIAAGAIGISTFGDFVTYTALGWFYKTAVEVIMLPVTYRVIAFIKRREPTYQVAV
ncbi:queuosine precursor transporter [Mycolicibacterium goodii]|uniref:Probable queuosine precursor transporter n=2 Tax=Mycolicibacterium goodii TaxID=134601 RepID=A0ABS6HJR1_MYCGD|nr:queuosine precursor transporter [Mycolicibacterium goodii]MBU8808344.1 queuosine precursor transporter [Mycolicibacterium goodii]MBU8814644.1 queuosine precursor transporter [Mycolicibacterium goodii]MBU8822913.1 queuosine precursor transporter [Mycolicibacterium goodii]MBU8829240.1 queuosine precursor transporter [Mycolicibacterium goodii]MBU8839195.1 queuosine precursor transporter [Mycolicibacterium goodii]